nr:SpoIIE family protein phosphatase [Modestobacter muralis]
MYGPAFDSWPAPGLLLDTQLVIVDATASYLRAVGRARDDLVGHYVFDVFPDRAGHGEASPLEVSMRTALETGLPDRLPLLSYPVEEAGTSVQRWWSVVNIPLPGVDGRPVGLLNAVEDLTEMMAEQESSRLARAVAEDLRRQSERLSSDLLARHQDLQQVRRAEARTARRLAALAEVSLALAGAETVEALTDVVIAGLGALGADGGAVGVLDETGTHLRLSMTDSLGMDARRVFSMIPMGVELPATVAARTGEPLLLGDRVIGSAFSPDMAEVYATAGREAWAAFPLQVEDRLLGSMTVGWDAPQDFAVGDVELLTAFAAQCAQALDRLLQRQAERSAATVSRAMSEALQRSLLTPPVQPDHLQIAVRYVPAVHDVQVGGDWYDAFLVSDGSMQLVVGDVSGHGQEAAAAMGQVRNVLRGIAHTMVEPPAAVLSQLDLAMEHLAVDTLVTAVLAKVEQTEAEAAAGMRTLRWSNAGHPPPVLIHPDATAELLERPVDRLLGVDPDSPRRDHTASLAPGSTVLLYTDGLVERRGVPLEEGFEWLRSAAQALAARDLPLEQLCDELLAQLGGEADDDIAILAIRAHPEDRPRPPEAGPSVLPDDLTTG